MTTTTGSSFAGNAANGFAPFDVSAATGGDGDVLETTNDEAGIYNKSTGSTVSTNTLQYFFGLANSVSLTDPHVTFDPWGGRYLAVVTDGTNLRLEVSATGYAQGFWCRYAYKGTTAAGQFADYPELGVDARNIYLTVTDVAPLGNMIFALSRADIEGCKNNPAGRVVTNIDDQGTSNIAVHVAPATDYDTSAAYTGGWMADPYPGGGSNITVFNWAADDLVYTKQLGTASYSVATSAAQPGGTYLDSGAPTFTNITKLGGTLYLAMTSRYDWGGGNLNSIVYWLRVSVPSVNGISLAKSGSFGTPGLWYFIPSTSGPATAGQYEDFTFAISSGTQAASGAITSYTDSTSAYSPYTVTFQGQGSFTGLSAGCTGVPGPCYRWGDFTSLYNDPSNPSTMWATSGAMTGSAWGTRITQLNNS